MCVGGGEEEEAGGEDPLLSATQLQSKRPLEQQPGTVQSWKPPAELPQTPTFCPPPHAELTPDRKPR